MKRPSVSVLLCLTALILTAFSTIAAAAPSISSLSPTSGGVGATVTINGSGFGATRGSSTVRFNGTAVSTYSSWNATTIVVVVPTGATTGDVVVRVASVNSNGQPFTVIPKPVITTFTPSSGTVGQTITIAGTNFGATQGTSTVKFFNNITATPTSWSDTAIVVDVPSGASTGNVVVTAAGGASTGVSFTVIATPNITSLSPSSGAVGATININGTHFQPTQGTSTVTFNGTPATSFTSWSATQIRALVPAGATTGSVVVTVFGTGSNGRNFTVRPTPAITSVSPAVGEIGMTVTVAGQNFGDTQGSSTVKFNGTTATVTSWSPSQIVVTVPTGATTGNVVVRTSGVDTNGVPFTVATLTSIAVTPSSLSLPLHSRQRFVATGTYSNGSTENLGSNVTWSTTNTARATVDTAGLVDMLTEGSATVQATRGAASGSATFTITPSTFMRLGNLKTPRNGHTATRLQNGKVLIVGGRDGSFSSVPTAELYDPATGAFTLTGQPITARDTHAATLLPDGKVLITGGVRHTAFTSEGLTSAELYNPATGTFTSTGSMNQGHLRHEATLLDSGLVLISGGRVLAAHRWWRVRGRAVQPGDRHVHVRRRDGHTAVGTHGDAF